MRVSVCAGAREPAPQHLRGVEGGIGGDCAELPTLPPPPRRAPASVLAVPLMLAVSVVLVPSGFHGRKVPSTARTDKHSMIYF